MLHTERPSGFSVGQIPFSKIEERARRLRLGDAMIASYTILILELDDAYLEWVRESSEKKEDAK